MPTVLQPGTDGLVSAGDARAFIAEFLGSHGAFLVAGPHAYSASGAAKLMEPVLAGYKVVRYSGFSSNPKLEELSESLQVFRQSGADRFLAVGGGSALDLAKLVNYFVSTGLTPEQYLQGHRPEVGTPFMPLLAAPTTAGTGSEATHFAVLYAGSVKYSIADTGLRPSYILLDPDFIRSLPPYQTACAGFDALAHAMESFWSLSATAESRCNSLQALELAVAWLPEHMVCSTTQSRAAMMRGAFLAGQAIDIAKTTVAHALSYSLTGHEGLPHGHAISVFLPAVAQYNIKHMLAVHGALRNAARMLLKQLQCATCEDLEDRLTRLRERIGLKQPFPGLPRMAAQGLIDRVVGDVNLDRLSNNPVAMTKEDLRGLVARALG